MTQNREKCSDQDFETDCALTQTGFSLPCPNLIMCSGEETSGGLNTAFPTWSKVKIVKSIRLDFYPKRFATIRAVFESKLGFR